MFEATAAFPTPLKLKSILEDHSLERIANVILRPIVVILDKT